MTRTEAIAKATAELSLPRLSPTILTAKRARIARYEAMTEAEYQAEAAAETARRAPAVARMATELMATRTR